MTILNGAIWTSFLRQENNAIVLDVRSPKEWKKGVLFDAITVDIDDAVNFEAFLKSIDKKGNYYIYSKFGRRGEMVCAKMETLGFLKTTNLDKGLLGYYLNFDTPFSIKKKTA